MVRETFNERMKRLLRETDEKIDALKKQDLYNDPGVLMKALMEAMDERIRLYEQKQNPPWMPALEAMLMGNLAGVMNSTDNGRLVKVWTEEEGVALLMQPAYTGEDAIIDFLLKHGADPNLGAEDGLSPLACAVMKDNVGAFEKLVRAGAKTDVVTEAGDTLTDLAEYNGSDKVMKILKDEKAMADLTKKPKKEAKKQATPNK